METPQGRTDYLSLLVEVWPLIMLAFVIAFVQGWRGVKRSYLHDNFIGTFLNIVLSSSVMALVAVAVTMVLDLFGADGSPDNRLGLTILLSAGGMKAVDSFMRKRFGFRIIDPLNKEHIQNMYNKMTPEQREQHIHQCAFRKECTNCARCQGVANDGDKETSGV